MRLTSTMRCTPLIFFLPTVLNLTWLWTTSWLKLMVTSLRVGESGDQFFTSCTRDVIGESGVPLCVARVSLLPFAFYQYVETKISGRLVLTLSATVMSTTEDFFVEVYTVKFT